MLKTFFGRFENAHLEAQVSVWYTRVRSGDALYIFGETSYFRTFHILEVGTELGGQQRHSKTESSHSHSKTEASSWIALALPSDTLEFRRKNTGRGIRPGHEPDRGRRGLGGGQL